MSEASTGPADQEFAHRLNHLFASIRAGNGHREYSNNEIARRVGVTGAYIGQLRNGRRGRPTAEVARRIEKAFGLDQPYLLSDDPGAVREIDQQLAELRELHDRGVWRFAMRARQVRTAEGRAMLDAAIDHVLRIESAQSADGTDEPRR